MVVGFILLAVTVFGGWICPLNTVWGTRERVLCSCIAVLAFTYVNFAFANYINCMHVYAYECGGTAKKEPVIVTRKNRSESLIFTCECRTGGIYLLTMGNASWSLSLKECAFPESFVRAFVIRQILYCEAKCGTNIFLFNPGGCYRQRFHSVYFSRRGVKSIRLHFVYPKRIKSFWVLKNGKTKASFWITRINNMVFCRVLYGVNGYVPVYVNDEYDEYSFCYEAKEAAWLLPRNMR